MAAAGIIIAALIAGGTALGSAEMSSSDQEKARSEEKDLAVIKRGDVLKQQAASDALTRASLAQSERVGLRGLAFQKSEAEKGRKERAEERAYKRKHDVYGNALNVINGNVTLADRLAKYWG